MSWRSILPLTVLLLMSTGGCSYLFYPHAKEFTAKAKGATAVETLINLTSMASAPSRNPCESNRLMPWL